MYSELYFAPAAPELEFVRPPEHTPPMILRVIVTLFVSLLGGGILLAASFFVVSGHDYTQEDTVGVITKHGLPFAFASTAPGYAWTQFDGSAATHSFWVFVAAVAALCLLFQRRRFLPRSTA